MCTWVNGKKRLIGGKKEKNTYFGATLWKWIYRWHGSKRRGGNAAVGVIVTITRFGVLVTGCFVLHADKNSDVTVN